MLNGANFVRSLDKPPAEEEDSATVQKVAKGGSLGSLRALNRGRVVDALRELGAARRGETPRRTGLSRPTGATLGADLQEDGLIVARDPSEGGSAARGGRPPALI